MGDGCSGRGMMKVLLGPLSRSLPPSVSGNWAEHPGEDRIAPSGINSTGWKRSIHGMWRKIRTHVGHMGLWRWRSTGDNAGSELSDVGEGAIPRAGFPGLGRGVFFGWTLGLFEDAAVVIKRQMCAFHQDRAAIGVCVITKQPICAECSTRYEGVNYSKEGLRILKQRRTATAARAQKGNRAILPLSLLASPVLLYAVYLFYRVTLMMLIDLQQISFYE